MHQKPIHQELNILEMSDLMLFMNQKTSFLPWLARLPVSLFAMCVGLFAIGLSWRLFAQFNTAFALQIAQIIGYVACALFGLLSTLYLAKFLFHRAAFWQEATHPLGSSFVGLFPLSVFLLVITYGDANHLIWLLLTLIALLVDLVITVRLLVYLTTGNSQKVAKTAALYMPTVAAGLVGSVALNTLGFSAWASLLWGMGLVAWVFLELRVLNHLYNGEMPLPMRPTIGLEMAPGAVGTLAAATIWPHLPVEVILIGLGIACGPILTVIARYKWWSQTGFTPGYWSFSFPAAALTSGIIMAVQKGTWPIGVAALALTCSSTLIVYLIIKTLILTFKGKLLPQ